MNSLLEIGLIIMESKFEYNSVFSILFKLFGFRENNSPVERQIKGILLVSNSLFFNCASSIPFNWGSIKSEIIAKVWKKKNNFGNLNIFIIGNFILLKKQLSVIKYKVGLKKINEVTNQNFKKKLHIYDIPLKFKNPFRISRQNKRRYIEDSFKIALELIDKKKITGLINCAVSKKELSSRKKFIGVTEFLAKKKGVLGKEAMLIYNNDLSVSPITTHIKLSSVSKNISKKKITTKTMAINNFFKKKIND